MKTTFSISKIQIIFGIILLVFVLSCKKDPNNQVPYSYVNIQLNVLNDLSTVGVGEYVLIVPDSLQQGYIKIENTLHNLNFIEFGTFTGKGIILYHADQGEWIAYDNTCTYEPQTQDAAVVVQNNGIYAQCPKCNSKFLLLDGSPVSPSLASAPLKQYQANFDPTTNSLSLQN